MTRPLSVGGQKPASKPASRNGDHHKLRKDFSKLIREREQELEALRRQIQGMKQALMWVDGDGTLAPEGEANGTGNDRPGRVTLEHALAELDLELPDLTREQLTREIHKRFTPVIAPENFTLILERIGKPRRLSVTAAAGIVLLEVPKMHVDDLQKALLKRFGIRTSTRNLASQLNRAMSRNARGVKFMRPEKSTYAVRRK